MLKRIRKFVYFFIFYSRMVYLFRFIYRHVFKNPIKVLYSHRIIEKSEELYPFLNKLNCFDINEFENKIKYLSKYYQIISIDDFFKYRKIKKRPANCVVLTFDDGYKCVYTKIFPILKKNNIPATVFLSVDYIGKNKLLWHDKLIYLMGKTPLKQFKIPELSNKTYKITNLDQRKKIYKEINLLLKNIDDKKKEIILEKMFDYLKVNQDELKNHDMMLTWDEIRQMQESKLITFGSHTMTHPILTKVDMGRVYFELQASKKIIEEKLNRPINIFSYPAGVFNNDVKNAVKKAGYTAAFTTYRNNEQFDKYILKREGFIQEPFYLFGLSIGGFFDLLKKSKYAKNFIPDNIFEEESKGFKYWLPHYFVQKIVPKEKINLADPAHIMLSIVDHFEPSHQISKIKDAEFRVKNWIVNYMNLAQRYSDSDGKSPQHTFFYPPNHDQRFLADLIGVCKKGYGEIEMHLHHNNMEPFPDTNETLKNKILKCIEDYSKYGIFTLSDGNKKFAFVHGDWSLDNSKGEEFCGINNEIGILKECGCYADFTFPSLGKAQPAMINRIYYANNRPGRPKSYNWGKRLLAGRKITGDLLLIPGIIGLRWKSNERKISIETSNIDETDVISPERIEYWVRNAVRIKGKPNWLFIKLHTHGMKAADFNKNIGNSLNKLFDYLLTNYNDKKKYFIHFVTAREMYNIIKAAESGENDNPNMYRDYEIPRYVYLNGK